MAYIVLRRTEYELYPTTDVSRNESPNGPSINKVCWQTVVGRQLLGNIV